MGVAMVSSVPALPAVRVITVDANPGGTVVIGLRTGVGAGRCSQCESMRRRKTHQNKSQRRKRDLKAGFHR